MQSEAELVLETLREVEGLDDVQQIVDRVCASVVHISTYRTALLVVYFEEEAYVGLAGGTPGMRERFESSASAAWDSERVRVREALWTRHRVGNSNIVWIPAEADAPRTVAFTPSEDMQGADWRPDDRLMVFLRGADGVIRGVLSLDRPMDGRRPDPADLGQLELVDRLMSLMRTVIENKYLSAKQRDSEQRYAAVVEQGLEGLIITRAGMILYANQRIGDMLGCTPRSLTGETLASLLRCDEVAALPGETTGELCNGVPVALRTETIRYDGDDATLVAMTDVSERRRLLHELMRAQKLETVGTLASGIAHDFSNLLSGISGYAALLKMRLEDDDPLVRYVDAITQTTERASAVTKQLLGVAREDEVRIAPFDVARVLGELERLLRETLKPSIRVEVFAPDDLPHVLGDESRIHQVLLNICLNARDAMPDGGVLNLEASEVRPDAIRVQVRDNGVGMDAHTLSKVFDPFFTTKAAGTGSGLGLYMAYQIIQQHNGMMDVVSELNRGTCVEVVLPARPVARTEAPASFAGGTVLVVDGEEAMRADVTEMLGELGFTACAAPDGREAARVIGDAETLRCAVLNVDVDHGWETARVLRLLRPGLPLVLSSARSTALDEARSRGLDVAACMPRPCAAQDLRAALERAATAAAAV
ncbi:MAG: ATP-binding protein [Planctomycetota bacterium]